MMFNRREQFSGSGVSQEPEKHGLTKQKAREILEVSEKTDNKEIKKAYYRLAKKFHPDKNPDNEKIAEEKFKKIQEAFELLYDKKEAAKENEKAKTKEGFPAPPKGRDGKGRKVKAYQEQAKGETKEKGNEVDIKA